MTDERDPTGVRHLLAGLKESGSMPDDLNDRIRASLEQEQAAQEDPAGEDHTSSPRGSDDDAPTWHRRWIVVGVLALVVALGFGVVLALGPDEPEPGSVASDTNTPDSEGGSGGSSTPSDSSQSSQDSPTDSPGTPAQVPAFAITDTDTDYSRATLPEKAAQLQADPEAAPELESPGALDGMDTAAAASDCLARLGHPELLPIVIDVATFDGEEGLLVMGQEAPEGAVRAWAVTTGCEPIWDQSFAIPTP